MLTLRQRCGAFLVALRQNAVLREGSPVDDLMAFVIAETGRKADERLEGSAPLCLYFTTMAEREEFVALFQEAKPNATIKRLP
jgi:hypothetical protein